MCDSHAIDYIGKWNKSVIELYACMRYVRIDKSFPIFIPESQLPPLWIPLMLFVSIFKIYFIIRKCDKGWEVSWFIFLQCLLLSFLVRWLIGGMFVNIKYLVCKLLPFFVLTVSWQYEASNLSSFRSTKIPFWLWKMEIKIIVDLCDATACMSEWEFMTSFYGYWQAVKIGSVKFFSFMSWSFLWTYTWCFTFMFLCMETRPQNVTLHHK